MFNSYLKYLLGTILILKFECDSSGCIYQVAAISCLKFSNFCNSSVS